MTSTAALTMGGHGGQSENDAGVMFGRFMLADMTEHPCRVTDLSIDGVTFLTEVEVGPLSQLVAYIQDVGRVEGRVIGAVPGGIRVAFQLSSTRRQRLESRLKWSQRSGGAADQRRHERFVPKDNKSHITLPDGRVYACEVIDISLSGAAVRTEVLPSLGTYLNLGKMRGRVVRYHESGIAIEFLKLLDRATLAAATSG
ncbi:MAG TPA: PilZ domain-containing protein [Aestuariivirgaceae bacterium]|nr:PilZ domain-containing protein [Aestuariivirgaceae bacterium]